MDFPRTVAQAEALDKLLELKKTEIATVLALKVGEEELVKRLLNRGKQAAAVMIPMKLLSGKDWQYITMKRHL